jgi:predicted homoserine dehydrogenase-like protein
MLESSLHRVVWGVGWLGWVQYLIIDYDSVSWMLLYFDLHIPQQRSLNRIIQSHYPSFRLVKQHHFSFLRETEICNSAWTNHFTDQWSSGRPDVQAIAAAAVDIAWQVALDAVGNTTAYGREEPLVG